MAYQRHWLLSWGGTLAMGADVWANNVRMINPETGGVDTLPGDAMEAMLDDFVTDIRALHQNAAAKIPNTVQVKWVKFNEIGPDGRYVDKSTTHARFLSGSTGANAVINGTANLYVPSFQSVCVTTTTARGRGPGSKGRLFVPQCVASVDQNSRIAAADRTGIANAYASFFTALGDEAGVDLHAIAPAVVSNVGEPGPAERITGVRVGDVFDVIRRRKSALVETYTSATVSTA